MVCVVVGRRGHLALLNQPEDAVFAVLPRCVLHPIAEDDDDHGLARSHRAVGVRHELCDGVVQRRRAAGPEVSPLERAHFRDVLVLDHQFKRIARVELRERQPHAAAHLRLLRDKAVEAIHHAISELLHRAAAINQEVAVLLAPGAAATAGAAAAQIP